MKKHHTHRHRNASFNFLRTTVITFVLTFIALSFYSFESKASHFRYGNITWTHVSGRTVTFHVTQAWRRTFYPGPPNVGNIVTTGTLEFGDATSAVINLTVTSVNVAEDWFFGEATITKTYGGAGTSFIAFWASNARISTLQNNANANFRVETTVTLSPTPPNNNSPVSSMPPIVNVQGGLAAANFILAASDPDPGNTLTYALSSTAQMGGAGNTQPAGLSIDPTTGVVTFNTIGKTPGQLYSTQMRVTDNLGAAISVDLIIKIVLQSTTPTFDYSVTPANGTVYEIQPGTSLCFDIKALDSDPGDVVTLSAVNLPANGTTVPLLPANGNPVQTQFCWTPTLAQLGTRLINFTAQDVNGSQINSSVTIIVSLDPVFDVPPTPMAGAFICVPTGAPHSLTVQAHAPDPTVNVQLTGVIVSPPIPSLNYLPILPTPAGNTTSTTLSWLPQASDWGTHDFTFTATDNLSNFTDHSFTLVVNTEPSFVSSPPSLLVTVGQTFTYNIIVGDDDMPFGDVVDILASGLPSWLTLTPTGPGTATLQGTPTLADAGTNSVHLHAEDVYHHCGNHVEQEFDIEVNPCNVSAQAIFTPISCYTGTTCVVVTGSGGMAPYTGEGTFCGIAAGTHTYEITDNLGCMASTTITIGEPSKLTVTATTTPTSCSLNDGSATATALDGTPGYSYLWSDGQTGPNATALSPNAYVVTATDANGCTATTTATVVSGGSVPGAPAAISGPPGLCTKQNGVVFCVTPDPNATHYQWTLPTGVTGSSVGPCITVSVSTKFKGGQICVKAINGCGPGQSTCLFLPKINYKPAKAVAINGPLTICGAQVVTYCIAPIPNAFSYLWTISGSATSPMTIIGGQGTTCITVNVPAGYSGGQKVKVSGVNCKGTGDDKYITIGSGSAPAIPASITGLSSVCKSSSQTFTASAVAGATAYQWAVNNNAMIVSGWGTASITVDFSMSTGTPVQVAVVSENACGMSSPRTKNVTVNPACREAADIGNNNSSLQSFTIFPNPTSLQTTVSLKRDGAQMLNVYDMGGRKIKSEEFSTTAKQNEIILDLSAYSKGLYMISVQYSDGSHEIKRLIVE